MTQEPGNVNDEAELAKQILQSLKRKADMNDLTLSLCKNTGWNWNKSAAFIQSIQTAHGAEIELLWVKIFTVAGIVSMAFGFFLLFYLFESLVGWNFVFSCVQNSMPGLNSAGARSVEIDHCIALTLLGLARALSNTWGYLAIALMVGGLGGYILARRQLRSTLEGK